MNTFFILIFNILASSQAVPDTTASDPIVAQGKESFRLQLAKFFAAIANGLWPFVTVHGLLFGLSY